MLAARTTQVSGAVTRRSAVSNAPLRSGPLSRKAAGIVRAIDETNIAINLLTSTAAGSVVAAVTLATSADKDKEMQKLMELDTWAIAPIGGAIVGDAVFHSIPVINVLFSLLAEPVGAACGVAYMMSLVLSSTAVDPQTLAPKGTILNADTATDSRASLRVPFTKIIPTALKVVDMKNEASSGAGWTIGESGLPRLPINSVLIVLGVGGVILEAASHAPIFSIFMPRVLQVAATFAAVGFAIDNFNLEPKTTSQ